MLKRFFGERVPLTLGNTINFDGSGRLNLDIPAFDYDELSGIALNWKGLTGQTDYTAGWKTYKSGYTAPLLHIKLADKGDIVMEDLRIASDTREGQGKLALGSSSLTLGRLSLQWQQGIDYNLRLNELVNLVTDLQIGAFINPTGTIPPSKITVEKLSFDTQMNEENGWANSEGRFRFDKLAYGDDTYGPLDISVAAEHLHTESLLAFKNKLAALAAKNMSEDEIRADPARHRPQRSLRPLHPATPIKLRAFDFACRRQSPRRRANHLQRPHPQRFGRHRLHPQKNAGRLQIQPARAPARKHRRQPRPQPVHRQPRRRSRRHAGIEDIHETLRAMVRSTVNSMAADGYLKLDDDDISTRLRLENGKLTLNGKILEPEPDTDFDDEEADAETAADNGGTEQAASAVR